MTKKKLPSTSVEAYKSLNPEDLREMYRKIIYALSVLGEANTEEIAAFLRVDHSKVWKRPNELHKAGLIYRPGNKRIMKSGRMGYTWMLTKEGLPTTSKAEKALSGKSVSDFSKSIQDISKQLPLL